VILTFVCHADISESEICCHQLEFPAFENREGWGSQYHEHPGKKVKGGPAPSRIVTEGRKAGPAASALDVEQYKAPFFRDAKKTAVARIPKAKYERFFHFAGISSPTSEDAKIRIPPIIS
jgi:hypothetical protein